MTIAIGADYDRGIIICADTKVVASDGATTSDMKISLALGPPRQVIAVATAAEDARAATMLAEEISIVAGTPNAGPEQIKTVMTAWHNAYGKQEAPNLQFIVGDGARKEIYLCEPPATVLECCPVAIGRGARAVEPYMDVPTGLVPHSAPVRTTLLRLAFLMHRAKKDEGSACGGDTHAMVLPQKGGFIMVSKQEMAAAESLANEIDDLMIRLGRAVTSQSESEDLMWAYKEIVKRTSQLDFPSIRRFLMEKEKPQLEPGK